MTEVQTVDGSIAAIDEEKLKELRSHLRGELLQRGDEGYDAARTLWNAMYDRYPALVVRPSGAADVVAAVNFARDNGLLLSVRGGAHSVPGFSVVDGCLEIDMSSMRGVWVDPERKTVVAQGGCVWGDVDHETQAFGLAVTGGQISHTGIAGLTLGGGIGSLMRKCGATVDNLISAQVVTADGTLRRASESENSDLFWALRGGGGNFGVVTSFEYRLHEIGPIVTGGMILYPLEQTPALLRFYREWMASAPDELTVTAAFLTAPPLPFVPAEHQLKPMVAFIVCHCGSLAEGQQAVDQLRAFAKPAVDMVGPIPYAVLQTLIDEPAAFGKSVYIKADYLSELSDEAIETFHTSFQAVPSPFSITVIVPGGGAFSRVENDATAFGHRDAAFSITIFATWIDPAETERNIEWARECWQSLRPWATGVYVNELDNEGSSRLKEAYSPETYARLTEVKNRYDPTNLFRLNQNIKPTA